MNYIDFFSAVVCNKPEYTAIIDENGKRRTSYRQLDTLSGRVARALNLQGIKAGSFVVIRMSRRMEYVAAVLGVLKNGCAFVPVLPSYPEERVRGICDECGCAAVIGDDFFDSLPETDEAVSLPDGFDAESAPACLLFTSGTTNKPKGIVHTMRGFTSVIRLQNGLMGGDEIIRTALAEFSFVASVSEIFVSLLDGATVCVVDEKTRMSLVDFSTLLEEQQIGGSFLTASHLRVFKRFKAPPKIIFLGGEPFPELEAELFEKTDFYNVYGQSETLGIMAVHQVAPGEKNIPVGRPIPGLELRLLKDDGSEAAPGEKGEICMIGPYEVSYLNEPEMSEKKFITLPDGRHMVHTGDIGRLDENGRLHYVSRKDSMVKINGKRVDIFGVEAHIREIPGVGQAAVRTVLSPLGSTCLAAYYTSSDGITETQIREKLTAELPDYMVPQFIVRLPVLPLNSSGKVDRNALPEPDMTGDAPYEAPANETEEKLCGIIRENLGCKRVGRHDDLRKLGADSLSCMQIIVEIEKCFRVRLEPSALLTASTPEALACVISGKTPTKTEETRLSTFNVLTAVAMFFLPFVHLIGEFLANGMVSGGLQKFGEVLELFASPVVFMLAMGYKLSFGEKQSGRLIRSGVDFLKLALIFDFFRYILTGLIMYAATGSDGELFIYFASSDIYMFIGLFYLVFGLMRKFKFGSYLKALIPVIMLGIFRLAAELWKGSGSYLTGTILGNLVYTGEYSFFPLLGWMYIPMIGYFCGQYIQKDPEKKDARIRNIGIVSVCLFAVCTVQFVIGASRIGESYLRSIPEQLVHVALTGIFVCFVRLPSGSRVFKALDRTGTLIMPYYMIHYVLVMLIMLPFLLLTGETFAFSPWLFLALGLSVFAVSLFLSKRFGVRLMRFLLGPGKKKDR